MNIRRRFYLTDYVPKPVVKVVVGVVGVLGFLLVVGAVYVWLAGQGNGGQVESALDVPRRPTPTRPGLPPPGSPVGVSVQSLTSPVAPGAKVVAVARTTPTANCTVTVALKDKKDVTITDPSLMAQAADEYGMVEWSWMIPPSAQVGTWRMEIRCSYYDKSGMVRGDFVVER